ncbi:helix-turn-helix domain-containing protein [Labrys monachus]|uniref:helix-turn-helix domain-containing protein n=1 Tax=Labrys monachus TaxID=217067 RepID=UPI003520DCFA
MDPRPYTPETLAERWGCTPNHVRALIKRGELCAFRIGPRLLRIPVDAVKQFEEKNTTQAAVSRPASLPPDEPIILTLTPGALALSKSR